MHDADEDDPRTPEAPFRSKPSWFIGFTGLGFILLQSACTAFMAISGLRLLIGIGALTAASSAAKFLDTVHGVKVRIPLMVFAVLGSVINLYSIWRVRTLRSRSSSLWRLRPVTAANTRAEIVQVLLAILTLVLIATEWVAHVRSFGGILR